MGSQGPSEMHTRWLEKCPRDPIENLEFFDGAPGALREAPETPRGPVENL